MSLLINFFVYSEINISYFNTIIRPEYTHLLKSYICVGMDRLMYIDVISIRWLSSLLYVNQLSSTLKHRNWYNKIVFCVHVQLSTSIYNHLKHPSFFLFWFFFSFYFFFVASVRCPLRLKFRIKQYPVECIFRFDVVRNITSRVHTTLNLKSSESC